MAFKIKNGKEGLYVLVAITPSFWENEILENISRGTVNGYDCIPSKRLASQAATSKRTRDLKERHQNPIFDLVSPLPSLSSLSPSPPQVFHEMEIKNVLSLPLGFGFYPTDVELVSHYLKRKSLGLNIDFNIIPEVDIYKHEPWDLPAKCHVPTRDCKWHFFTTRDRKYPNGLRSNRATEAGYWKSTGKDRRIRSKNCVVGTKKTLVFHKGRPPSGKRTDWIMHEYYLDENEYKASPGMKDTFVLCRITKRDGLVQETEELYEIDNCANQPEDAVANLVVQCDDDVKAWIEELYEPNFCTIPAITGTKEKDNLIAPKQEVENPCSPPNISEDSVHFLPEIDNTNCFLDTDFFDFNLDMFGEYGAGVALDDILTLSSAGEHTENPMQGMNSSTILNMVGSHGSNFIGENDEDTKNTRSDNAGIQIRQRHPRFSNTITKEKIRLQVHKMEGGNREIMNKTVEYANEDHHLEFNNGIGSNEHWQPPKEEISLNEQYSENSSSVLTSNLPKRRFSLGNPDRVRSIQPENTGYFRRLNILFVAGIAALILYFLLCDATPFFGITSRSDL
ncbi:hypothetical protein J5N97_007401 [Dioscorea zingiberensis]|uniref:NAC domain-containing protein n=1 Tax=Dioscorea zingiberensis TaxID=325984 RepID=A0A9D5DC79_9LILI|nr:hypothetical protein J5N97_007401 [Dioscorea zingiberensis]